ncbi:hypothetical protein [uncultured Dokdonia sp.]|uniref:hypothetical protein n=1 Tax=uncultured Dokdonia sp. TaxID=575653 RepID=UPI002620DDB6|nr:hypothetical protein [uncultured Dokdonia sp.]
MLKKYISLHIYPKLALWILIGFIGCTIVGTLTHELGHIAFAKAFGYKTHLGYGYMNYYDSPFSIEFDTITARHQEAISSNSDFLEKERREELLQIISKHRMWVIFGGPLQTILTGTIALFLLYRQQKEIQELGMKWTHWLLVFLSLFWFRETTNLAVGVLQTLSKGSFDPFGGRSDELRLARWLGWWEGSISLPLALLGLAIGMYVIFRILPKSVRLTFLSAGFMGGILGYMIWLVWVGPILMP